MSRTERVETHENRVIFGCFEVKGNLYAIDVSYVKEIVRWQPVSPLPKAPALIEGVVDLRAAVIPVVDLGRVLLGEPTEPGPRRRILVSEVDGLALGLVVDAAVDVLAVDVADLGDPPPLATQAGYDATRAVVRRKGEAPILVLSMDHVLESVYRSAIDGEEAA